ncbi:MAG: ABC transporter permease [Anaerolineae bacterium]|nr:ABC transporter permease [Anaerolineae bacterium]
MRNFWLLAKTEYWKMVKRRGFLVGTMGIPLLLVLIMGVSIMVAVGDDAELPVGYVDHSGILAAAHYPDEEDFTTFTAFPDEIVAKTALESGDIQAYFIVSADYLSDNRLTLVYWDENLGESIYGDIVDFIRINLLADYPPQIQERLMAGPDLVVRTADGSREFNSAVVFSFFIPFVAAFFFLFVVMGASGYLLQVVTDEKENRTVEIMMTTVRPTQLIGGKTLGLMLMSLTQILIWMGTAVLAVIIAAAVITDFPRLTVPWALILIVVLFFIPAYALVAGMMATIGSTVGELQHAQQVAGIINLLFLMPFFFMGLFFTAPNSPILVVLTFFPTTSFLTVMMRWGMSTIPIWQVMGSWLILVGTAVFFFWLAAKVFHIGMMRYGKGVSLKETWAALRA